MTALGRACRWSGPPGAEDLGKLAKDARSCQAQLVNLAMKVIQGRLRTLYLVVLKGPRGLVHRDGRPVLTHERLDSTGQESAVLHAIGRICHILGDLYT